LSIQVLIDLWGDLRRGYTKESKALELAAQRLGMTRQELLRAHPDSRCLALQEIAWGVSVDRVAQTIADRILAKTQG
jgi:hypothetical protein